MSIIKDIKKGFEARPALTIYRLFLWVPVHILMFFGFLLQAFVMILWDLGFDSTEELWHNAFGGS